MFFIKQIPSKNQKCQQIIRITNNMHKQWITSMFGFWICINDVEAMAVGMVTQPVPKKS